MAYDTMLDETLTTTGPDVPSTPSLKRDNLSSPYFPCTSPGLLAAVVVLCGIFLLTSIHRLHYTDLWGHLSLGRWIAEQGQLPSADPFAASETGQSLVHVAWLSQVLGYQWQQAFGNEGLVLLHALLVMGACGLLMAASRRRGESLGWAALAGATAFVLTLPINGIIRPQLLGMLGFPLVLLACRDLDDRWRSLLGLPVLFLVWANLHGSFAAGLMVLGIHTLVTGGQAVWKGGVVQGLRDARLHRAVLGLLLAVLASCLNPAGPAIFWVVATFGQHVAVSQISEWQPLVATSFSGGLFFGSLVILGSACFLSGRRLEVRDVLLLLVFGLFTLLAMRMLVWWGFVFAWVATPQLSAAWSRVRSSSASGTASDAEPGAMPGSRREASMRTVLAMGFIFMTLLLAPPSHALISGLNRGEAQTHSRQTPLYVAEEIAARDLAGNIFAPMDWADYLLWKSNGQLRPLVYSHVHFSSPALWNQYQEMAAGKPTWLAIAREHDLKYLVVNLQTNRELRQRVLEASRQARPPVRIIYRDQRSLLVQLLP